MLKHPKAIVVTGHSVVTNAVDYDQAGADVVVYQDRMVVTFIDNQNRDIYLVTMDGFDHTPSDAVKIVDRIDGSWVRGNVLRSHQGNAVYGMICDTGRKGGSGYNQFLTFPIEHE
ncbi:MAG: hypothetical protein AAF539_12145 [Planctomycetota bacterium]